MRWPYRTSTDTLAAEEREAARFDQAARQISDNDLFSIPPFSKEDERRLASMGDVRRKRVLDVGCGSGEWTCRLAGDGARVSSVDISPLMVELTRRRAKIHGLEARVDVRKMSALRLEFPDGEFDVAHGQDIIHHLDPDLFGCEVARVLKLGGVAVFHENNGNNVLLMAARRLLCGRFGISKWSTDDEYPITRKRRLMFCSHFSKTRVEYPQFLMFHYLDAKLFRYKVPIISALLKAADRFCGAIPLLKRYSYRQLLICTR